MSKLRGLLWLSGIVGVACGDDTTGVTGDEPGDSTAQPEGSSSSGEVGESSTSLDPTSSSTSSTGAETSDGSSSEDSSGDASTSGDAESSSSGSAEDSSSTGDATACEPPMLVDDVILDCDLDGGYVIAQYRSDAPGVPTAHMVSIGSPRYFGHDAPVHFNVPGTNVLVLHSGSPTQWAVDLGPLGSLDEVWVFGGANGEGGGSGSTVTAPEGVLVMDGGDPYVDLSDCYNVPDDQYEACTLDARRVAYGAIIGQEIDEADGCYDGQHFELEPSADCGGTPGASLPQCDPQVGEAGVPQDDCAEVLAESVHCAYYDGVNVGLVGMDSGDSCVLAQTAGEVAPFDGGLGWVGDNMYVCDGTVWQISLLDGSATDSGTSCSLVTELGDQILVVPDPFGGQYAFGDVVVYADFAAVVADTPNQVHSLPGFSSLNVAAEGDTIYDAWFYDHRAPRRNLVTGEQLPDVPFLCWDGWVGGIDALDGSTYVLAWMDQQIKRFDNTSGAFLGQVEAPVLFGMGLACRPGA